MAIVIDQLGWDDRVHFPGLTGILGPPRKIISNIFPTLTESVHASFSTGDFPGRHGVIGGEAFRLDPDVRHLMVDEYLYRTGLCEGRSLVQALERIHVQSTVISGKSKVAQLLDPRPDNIRTGNIRITFDAKGATFEPLFFPPSDVHPSRLGLDDLKLPAAVRDATIDGFLLDAAERILRNPGLLDPGRDQFAFVGLPFTDVLGHITGHKDPDFLASLTKLDRRLSLVLREIVSIFPNYRVLVCGDHGVREVDTLVRLDEDSPELRLSILRHDRTAESRLLPAEDVAFHGRDPMIIFDGGTVRFWTRPGRRDHLAEVLRRDFRDILAEVIVPGDMKGMDAHRKTSRHLHWGDLFGTAQVGVGLLKPEWRPPIRGEHGTDLPEDRCVPVWGTECYHSLRREALAFFRSRRTGQ